MYTYYSSIDIKAAAVGANETNFPVALVLTDTRFATTGNGGHIQNLASGGASGIVTVPADFVVSPNSDGSTPFDFEIVDYNPSTGYISLRVKIPTLDSGTDETIYLCYGDVAVTTSQEDVSGTWSDNFQAVYHLTNQEVSLSEAVFATSLWLKNKRAAYYNNKTYYVYLDRNDTNIKITYYDHSTNTWAAEQTVGAADADNAHCAPCVALDSSGYIYVSWGSYEELPATGDLHLKKSTNTEDITAWGADETPITAEGRLSYPTLIVLSDDDLVLFYRLKDGTGYIIRRVVSTDGGDTWANDQLIIDGANDTNDLVYYDVALGGSDRVHIAYHIYDASATLMHDLYYAYSDNASDATSSWKEADGDAITLPMQEGAGYLVFNSDAAWDAGYLIGIDAGSDNVPHIAYFVSHSTNTDKILHFRYSSGWSTNDVIASNNLSAGYTASYTMDGDILATDSLTAEIVFTIDVSGTDELQEYSTTDGSSWAKNRDVTTGSSLDNAIPCYPYDVNDECRFIWMAGPSLANWNDKKIIYYSGSDTGYSAQSAGINAAFGLPDSSGNDYHLTNVGGSLSATGGSIDGYAEFDGASTEYAEVESAAVTSFPFTFEAWAYTADIVTLNPLVFCGDKDDDDNYCSLDLAGHAAGDPVRAFAHDYGGLGGGWADSTSGYSASTWVYAVGIQAATNDRRAYLDGANKGTNTDATEAAHSHDRTAIAARRDSNANYCGGVIRLAEVRISSVVRDDDWILTAYTNQKNNAPNGTFWSALTSEVIVSESVCWGHVTGVVEDVTLTFDTHWTGTGTVDGAGDNERIELSTGENMESEVVKTGSGLIELDLNFYQGGDDVTLKYRHGATQVACEAAAFGAYTVPFDSLGYVQIRLESTL